MISYLNLCLHKLSERKDVQLRVPPNQAMVAWCDLVNRIVLHFPTVLVFVLHLNKIINQELENTICGRFSANRVFSVIERD